MSNDPAHREDAGDVRFSRSVVVPEWSGYLEDARLKEDAEARAFLELDRGRLGGRAREFDAAAASLARDLSVDSPIYLLAPELSCSENRAAFFALHLLGLGYQVHLVTRLDRGELSRRLLPVLGADRLGAFLGPRGAVVRFVRPLESYLSEIRNPGGVASFYLPLSGRLVGAGVPHICVLPDGEAGGHDPRPLAYLPDLVAGPEQALKCRRVFPGDDVVLTHLLGAARALAEGHPPAVMLRVPSVSACLIARDEEGMIEDCLASLVACADEVVVNDTGSTDRTREIARSYGAIVIGTRWEDDFSKARNATIDAATGDYVLVIDADERVLPETRGLLKDDLLMRAQAYTVKIRNRSHDDHPMAAHILRVFRRSPRHRYSGAIHEQVAPSIVGRVAESRLQLDHLGYLPEVVAAKGKRARNAAILAKSGDDPETRLYYAYQEGVELRLSGNLPEAARLLIEVYDKSSKDRPFAPYAALNACDALLSLGRFEDALALFRRAMEDFPGYMFLSLRVAETLARAGRHRDALEALSACPPGRTPVRSVPEVEGAARLYHLVTAKVLLGLGRREESLVEAARALDADPDWPSSQAFLVENWPDNAEEMILARSPGSVRGAVIAYAMAGKHDASLRLARDASDKGALGEALLAAGQYREAAERLAGSRDGWDRQRALCLSLLDLAPLDSMTQESILGDGLNGVGYAFTGTPAPTGKVREVTRVLSFLLRLRAYDAFTRALPSLANAQYPELIAGRLLLENGRPDMAVGYLAESCRSNPNPDAMAALAKLLHEAGDCRDAAVLFGRLRRFRPLRIDEYAAHASCLLKCGEVSEARRVLADAQEVYPDSRIVGDLKEAVERLER